MIKRAAALILTLLLLTACGGTLHDEGRAKLIPAVEQKGSTQLGFAADLRFSVEMEDGERIAPTPLIEPGALPIRRAPGTRVYLAGSADGTAPIEIDDFLILEIEDPSTPSGIGQFAAGDIGQVRRQKVPVENLYQGMPIPAGAIDLTDLLPACETRLVGAVPMDLGVIAQSTPVYLIVEFPETAWTPRSCAE
ncbi:MAG: hypothetical protein KI792_14165 [Alphaproteobacteria bacterium]|nr:hypothetical protein [Alphaproteobacteria bacterium SS10]